MMEEIVFQANRRDVIGKQVKALRREGKLPAILYGYRIEPIPVSLDAREAGRVLPMVTSSHLVVVDVDGERHNALVREKQRDPVQGTLLHVDFMVVSMTEKLRANVVIELEGDAPAIREFNGALVTGTEELEVECLPQDLPERITVDLSILKEIGDSIHVKDLVFPASVEVLTDPEELVVLVTSQAAEEVEEEVEEEELEEEGEPEVIERGKKEEEEEY
jgi:large subunit ribosomal protein L25